MIKWKPKCWSMARLHTMLCLMIDTGVRIDEAIGLKRSGVDFENLLVTVYGKGEKERIIPISRDVEIENLKGTHLRTSLLNRLR